MTYYSRIKKLPLWSQKLIETLRKENKELKKKLKERK